MVMVSRKRSSKSYTCHLILKMDDLKSRMALARITCEEVVLFTTEYVFLLVEGHNIQVVNLFLPTVCFSCEKDEMRKLANDKRLKEIPVTMWISRTL